MSIRTPEDWWKLAREVAPDIPAYAEKWRIIWDEKSFEKAMDEGRHEYMVRELDRLWSDLPDIPEIRAHPFFDACDLITESWVFEEQPS